MTSYFLLNYYRRSDGRERQLALSANSVVIAAVLHERYAISISAVALPLRRRARAWEVKHQLRRPRLAAVRPGGFGLIFLLKPADSRLVDELPAEAAGGPGQVCRVIRR